MCTSEAVSGLFTYLSSFFQSGYSSVSRSSYLTGLRTKLNKYIYTRNDVLCLSFPSPRLLHFHHIKSLEILLILPGSRIQPKNKKSYNFTASSVTGT